MAALLASSAAARGHLSQPLLPNAIPYLVLYVPCYKMLSHTYSFNFRDHILHCLHASAVAAVLCWCASTAEACLADKCFPLTAGAGAGGLAGHEHNKHHSGTGNGSRTGGTGSGFGSDQGYGSGTHTGSGTGNTASNVKSHVPGTEEHRSSPTHAADSPCIQAVCVTACVCLFLVFLLM